VEIGVVEAARANGEPVVSASEVRRGEPRKTRKKKKQERGAIAMRSVLIALASVVLVVSASAQEKAQPRSVLPDELLNAYLGKWEEHMAKVASITSNCVLTEDDGTEKRRYVGTVAVLKPNHVRLQLKAEDDPKNEKKWRTILADGTDVWEFDYRNKVARVRALPKQGLNHAALTLLLGGKAADLQKRYDFTIDPARDLKDNNYVAIGIRPKAKEDEQDMVKAELVLWKNDKDEKLKKSWLLPARLWIQQPNQDQITWTFLDPAPANLTKADFAVPKLPADWKTERQPVDATSTGRPK
jgi:TIGR03009 family protein